MNYLNNVKTALMLAPALYAVLHTIPAQAGNTANITITATIVNRTCTPDWTNDPGKTSIDLGTVDIAGKSNPLVSKEFTLGLKDCTGVSKVKVTASGTPMDDDATDFKNNGTAEHIGLYIKGGPSEDVTLHPNGSGEGDYTVINNVVEMKFLALLEKTKDGATAGTINVPFTLNMNYE